ncbi:hypothetical protein C9414_19565, partial [Bacillus sp. Nf3]
THVRTGCSHQLDVIAELVLPDMGHLVDEEGLESQGIQGVVVAIDSLRKVHFAIGRDASVLVLEPKKQPVAMVVNLYPAVVDRVAKHQSCHLDLAERKAPLMAGGAHLHDRNAQVLWRGDHTLEIEYLRCTIGAGRHAHTAPCQHRWRT